MKLEISDNNRINLINLLMGLAMFLFTPILFHLFDRFFYPINIVFILFIIVLYLLETYAMAVKFAQFTFNKKLSYTNHPEILLFVFLYYVWSFFLIGTIASWNKNEIIGSVASLILVLQVFKCFYFSGLYMFPQLNMVRNISKNKIVFSDAVLVLFVFINSNFLLYMANGIWHLKTDPQAIILGSLFFALFFVPIQLPILLERAKAITKRLDYWLYWLFLYWLSLAAYLQLLRI